MASKEEEPKVFWKSSVPDPDSIDLDDLLNNKTAIALDEEDVKVSTPIKGSSDKKGPKPSPMKHSLEVNAEMSK